MNNVNSHIEAAIRLLKQDEQDNGCAPSYAGWYYHQYDLNYVNRYQMANIRRYAKRVAKVFRRGKDGKFVRPAADRAKARLRLKRLIEIEVDKGVRDFVDDF